MKRLLSSKRKETKQGSSSSNLSTTSVDKPMDIVPTTSNQSNESHEESFKPIFQRTNNVDMNLNVNPTIANKNNSDDDFSLDTTMNDYSLFTGTKKSFSTKQSSYMSSGSTGGGVGSSKKEFGTTLHTLNMVSEETDETTTTTPSQIVSDGLVTLVEDVSFVVNQFNHGIINLTTCVINTIDCFKRFIAQVGELDKRIASWKFTSENNKCVRQIIRYYLNFYDNLLKDEAYIKLKLLLVKHFNDFAGCLDSSNDRITNEMIKPKNYAIGYDGIKLPNQDLLERIIEKISKSSSNLSIKEQSGSFLAPITRGITQELSILCLYFGYPEPNDYHFQFIQSLYELYDDIHMMIIKNKIELAATAKTETMPVPPTAVAPPPSSTKFKIPFRIPTDITQPPMSMSISLENSLRTSGTLGGYIYPIINIQTHPELSYYAHSQFAITCGHVCLDGNKSTYPHVSVPSSVLISMYKNALSVQYTRSDSEAKVAYGSILSQLDQLFPVKKVNPQLQRNLPSLRFGQIIWGERTLIENNQMINGISDLAEKRLSDLAIVKINKKLSCRNFLGDDVSFNEFDPGLMFDNLYIRKVINLSRYVPKNIPTTTTDVDSTISDHPAEKSHHGISVFKYGSTTKYTRGNLNGIKLVYWQDGAIHSSEFIVNSPDNITPFAAGGDSGSWVLTKLEDLEQGGKGLGVLGMLHSYDGEFRQFGLFTPMNEILTRLEEVTNIKWGVVGCEEKSDDIESSSSDHDSDTESESEVD
ncbi:SPS-sensor serine protease component SSY5 [Spathaspora sp. JA1]|nr:SPS-sensor serine protease component SSY5 [Spathaspora sp. JA1]